MSSEQEENIDHLDDPNANSSAAETNQSPEKKNNGLNEHAKPRRRRRGKKRKHKKESAPTCDAENHEHCEGELHVEHDHVVDCGGDSPSWDSDENLSCDVNTFTDVIIRPVNVPKAPENSTQFIMDDHNDCRFYMSFETPNPYLTDPPFLDVVGDIVEPIGEDAAYRDIDYQYESPQDFDNTAYYDREFELSYKNNRFDELMRLSRGELISALQGLELRLKELSEAMVKENPSPTLEKLQAELLELQEKHSYLKECNTRLTTVLLQGETTTSECSVKNITPEDVPEILSDAHDVHEGHSYSEVYQECNEPVEEATMIDVSAPKCDKNSLELNSGTQILPEQVKSNENSSANDMNSSDSDEEEQTKLNLNSRIVQHCQTANSIVVKDDVRTLAINNSSDLFHAKCSSSVPLEGGMSPSETSVN